MPVHWGRDLEISSIFTHALRAVGRGPSENKCPSWGWLIFHCYNKPISCPLLLLVRAFFLASRVLSVFAPFCFFSPKSCSFLIPPKPLRSFDGPQTPVRRTDPPCISFPPSAFSSDVVQMRPRTLVLFPDTFYPSRSASSNTTVRLFMHPLAIADKLHLFSNGTTAVCSFAVRRVSSDCRKPQAHDLIHCPTPELCHQKP